MRIHNYYSDSMVLQANAPVVIKGFVDNETDIVATLSSSSIKETRKARIEGNRFFVEFDKKEPSFDTFTLSINSQSETIELHDIVFGDVYLCAGQSNMEIGLQYMNDPLGIYESYKNRKFRMIDVPNKLTKYSGAGFVGEKTEQEDFAEKYPWNHSGAPYDSIRNTSGFAYIFAGLMSKKTKYPIGVVNTAVGGSDIHHWLRKDDFLDESLKAAKERINSIEGKSDASCIYNEKICPLSHLRFRSVLWLLGECLGFLDYKQISLYGKELEYLDRDFSIALGYEPNICLIDIGMESYSHYYVSLINEQISLFSLSNTKRFIECPVFDLSSEWLRKDGSVYPHPIHIIDKEPQARRTVELVYEKFVKGSACELPRIVNERIEDDSIILEVKSERGISSNSPRVIEGFQISSSDSKYVTAEATLLDGHTIKVHSKYVKNPQYVTYCFYDYNDRPNLYSKELPLLPYRSNRNEDPNEYGYQEINPSFLFNRLKGYRNSFSTLCGGAGQIELYSISPQFGSKNATLDIENEGLRMSFARSYEDACFMGLGLNVSIDGMDNHFERYHNIALKVEAKEDLEFTGIHFITPRNERFYVVPQADGIENRNMTLSKGREYTLVFNFDSAINKMESTIRLTNEMKEMICGMQITFRNYKETNSILFKNITFYYGDENDVQERKSMDRIYKYG